MMIPINKLVRDLIPSEIRLRGCKPVVATPVDNELFDQLLRRKIQEEAIEVFDAKKRQDLIEEIGDLKDVIEALEKLHGISEEVEDSRTLKTELKGGFDNRIYLICSTNEANSPSLVTGEGGE